MGYRVAVVGATGNVGREMLAILAKRSFPADEVIALASRRSQGSEVSFGDKTLKAKSARAPRLLRRRHLPDVGGRDHRGARLLSEKMGPDNADSKAAGAQDEDSEGPIQLP